tara:strand:+ start:696 stop:893 length:198 start_codon:yes stop_codon:yes gene_type:complete
LEAEDVYSDVWKVYGFIDGNRVTLRIPEPYEKWQDDFLSDKYQTTYLFSGKKLAEILTGFIEEEK